MIPNIAIRTTLIVGYPGETEEDFEEMKEWVREMRFDRLGVFAYSHEEDTPAFDLEDDVDEEVKQNRVNEIMEIQAQVSFELNQEKIGKTFKCIFDRVDEENFIGRTEYDSPDVDNEVLISKEDYYVPLGEFIDVEIFDAGEYDLYGKPLGKVKNRN